MPHPITSKVLSHIAHRPGQKISLEYFLNGNFTLYIKREDLLHPPVSGNKYRKLKYNIHLANKEEQTCILTFGGAFSNHIAAVAAYGKEVGIKTIGVIRGEELLLKVDENPTLSYAKSCGMELHFISRELYRKKDEPEFIKELHTKFGPFYLIPEGGTNELAVMGCTEILTKSDRVYDYICVPVGTGGTLAGLVKSSLPHQKVIGFSALKGTFQQSTVKKYSEKGNFEIMDRYCFGGYAKVNSELVNFINYFRDKTGIALDPIYTGKMMFGIIDMLKNGEFRENSLILAIHTGGLQGIAGINLKLNKKKLPTIHV